MGLFIIKITSHLFLMEETSKKQTPTSDHNPFELTLAQQLALENFTRGVKETDPEWVQALAIDLYRQLFIHKNLFNAHLKGDF